MINQIAYAFIGINVSILTAMFCLGVLVKRCDLKVNYTRKVVHFLWFFAPIFVYELAHITDLNHKIIISVASISFILLIMQHAFRTRFSFCQNCFDSIDRPEDRPKTLWWLASQTFAGYCVLIFFYLIFEAFAIPAPLLYLTILAVTIGDGLAEPIGIRFGRRQYEVKAFCDARIYYRTLEGSLVVYLASLILSAFFAQYFNNLGFIALLLIFPLVMSITEAKSPHTWDTPLLFFAGNLTVLLIYATCAI